MGARDHTPGIMRRGTKCRTLEPGHGIGLPFMYPIDPSGCVESPLRMMSSVRSDPCLPNPVPVLALELSLNLHRCQDVRHMRIADPTGIILQPHPEDRLRSDAPPPIGRANAGHTRPTAIGASRRRW